MVPWAVVAMKLSRLLHYIHSACPSFFVFVGISTFPLFSQCCDLQTGSASFVLGSSSSKRTFHSFPLRPKPHTVSARVPLIEDLSCRDSKVKATQLPNALGSTVHSFHCQLGNTLVHFRNHPSRSWKHCSWIISTVIEAPSTIVQHSRHFTNRKAHDQEF